MARLVNISDVCNEIFAGGDAPKNNMSVEKTDEFSIPIYSNGEAENGLYGYTNFARVTEPSITISARGTIGFAAIRNEPFVPIVRLITLTPNLTLIDIRYLYYAVQNYHFDGSGTSIPQLTVPMLRQYSFPLPEIEKQIHISTILDKLNSVISLRKQQLAKLDELVKARFVEMFGDPVLNPKRWPNYQLKKYIKFLTSGSRGWAQYFTDQGEYFITIKNVKNCCITLDDVQHIIPPNNSETKRTKLETGDLLISITADLGRTGVVSDEIAKHGAYINQHLTCIRLDRTFLHPLYVAYYLESEAGKMQFQTKNQNGVKAGLNFNAINSLKILLPPLDLQEKFVTFCEKLEKQRLTIYRSLDKIEILKKSLMQEYFG